MILIDLGNTNAKIFKDDQILKIGTEEIYEYLDQFQTEDIVISSVVPRLTKKLQIRYPNVQFIDSDNYNLMFTNDGQLNSKGADRMIAAYGAQNLYGTKILVCDIGTCVTLDVVDGRRYLSGLIYPGFAMLENLLNEKIEQLPMPASGNDHVSTSNQIFWANIYGFVGAISMLVEKSLPDSEYKLVITGGSVLKLKEEYNVDIIGELAKYHPVYEQHLIKQGLKSYIKLINNCN